MKSVGQAIDFGQRRIPYSLTFSRRKQLKITVFPDGRVAVDAPKGRTVEEVASAIRKRVRWIATQRLRFEKFQPLPTPKRYVSGETHRYLGRQYRLRVRQGAPDSVKLSGGFLWVLTDDTEKSDRIRNLVESWYRERAWEVFERRLEECHDRVKHHGIPSPGIRLRKMKSRGAVVGSTGRWR